MKKYIEENNFEKTRKQIKENPNTKIIFSSNDDELNRKVLEKLNIDTLLLKQSTRKDFQKQRNSGLNHVLAKIAKKKNIEIGIDLDEVINSDKYKKEQILSRIQQNIKLCNKNKLRMKFYTKNNKNLYDLKALGLVLGMNTSITKTL